LQSGGESCTVEVQDEEDSRPEWVKICSIKDLKENSNVVSKKITLNN
jgi:hypothetical protein